ncbi:MAG: hypothetical protein LBJ88_04285 [Campylobacteraceae bacterium]|jgi:hypothetical protein|nr:hypothetical protein [Campylobacteraceae bacterium]
MNSSRRFFTKTALSLAASLFLFGCGSTETSTTTEYDGFIVEHDTDKRVVNFIHTSDEDVTVILKQEGDERRFTTADGKTILVLTSTGYEIKHTSYKLKVDKNSAGDTLLTFSSL